MVMNPMVQSNNKHLPTKPFDYNKIEVRGIQPQKRPPKMDPLTRSRLGSNQQTLRIRNGMSWGVKLPPFFEALFGVSWNGGSGVSQPEGVCQDP